MNISGESDRQNANGITGRRRKTVASAAATTAITAQKNVKTSERDGTAARAKTVSRHLRPPKKQLKLQLKM